MTYASENDASLADYQSGLASMIYNLFKYFISS